MSVPDEFKVNKLKESFTASEKTGEVSSAQFAKVLERLGVHASRLDMLLLFDYIDVKKTDMVNYMQFYRVVKENMANYPESTAQDLISNITMEHQMTQRGRKLRLEHKKRLNETKVPPKASSVPPVDEIATPANKRNNLEPSPHVRGRRRSHEPSSRRNKEEAATRHRNTVAVALGPRRRLDLFDTNRRNSEPSIEEALDKDIDDFVNFGESPRSAKNRGRTKDKKKDDYDMFGKDDGQLNKELRERFESLDDTVRTLMIESQQSILEAIAQAAQQRTSDLSVVARDLRSLVGGRLGDSDVGSQIKEDIQRLAQKVTVGSELDRIRADVRAIRDDHDPHINSEMQRSLESLEQSLSNVGDHVGFNLGTKLDHMEAKLSRILTTVAAKNPDQVKSLDPKTEAELRDERKRLREAIKFIEAQVKKFKQQKSDYKNQIRLESEKIRKERKLLSKEKDLLRKESASLESARSELKELRYQVSKAQRKLRKGSMMSADMSILNLHQDEEVEKLKQSNSSLTEQVQKLKIKFKEERKNAKQLTNELKSSNKRLSQEKDDLEVELGDVQDARKKLSSKVNELTTQVMDLNVQKEENAHRALGNEKDKQNKDDLEKERAYLAKMKLRLQDLAQKLNDERDNNAVAHDLDKKAKNIATQMKLLSAEREALYSEREQFEAEKASFLEDRAEKDQGLKAREDEIVEARKRTEAQAKIMKREYPKFQGRLAKLEAEEKRQQEKAKELSELENKLNTSTTDLTKKVEAVGKDRDRLNRESEVISKRSQELARKDEKINEMKKEVQKMKEELTLTKTTLRVKQDAFESMTRDFERLAEKGGASVASTSAAEQTKLVERLLQEETARLQKEFAAEKKKLEKEVEDLRKTKDDPKAQKEAEFVLEQEKERIKYLAKELHAAMDDLEKQKVAFEGEKRNWLRVISELIDDEAVLKEIHKMFDKDNKSKGGGGLPSIPSPRVPKSTPDKKKERGD